MVRLEEGCCGEEHDERVIIRFRGKTSIRSTARILVHALKSLHISSPRAEFEALQRFQCNKKADIYLLPTQSCKMLALTQHIFRFCEQDSNNVVSPAPTHSTNEHSCTAHPMPSQVIHPSTK
jgi:hypothetical protein